VVERGEWVATGAVSLHRRAVDEDHVEAAIIVAIEESSTAAGRINDVVGFGSGDVNGGEADFLGNILEGGDRRQTAAVFLGGCGELGERNMDAPRLLAGGLWTRGGCESENEDEN